jgi:hypothetical protein
MGTERSCNASVTDRKPRCYTTTKVTIGVLP